MKAELLALLRAFGAWLARTIPILAAWYAGRLDKDRQNAEQALDIVAAQRDIAGQPDASVDAVADWLSGGDAENPSNPTLSGPAEGGRT